MKYYLIAFLFFLVLLNLSSSKVENHNLRRLAETNSTNTNDTNTNGSSINDTNGTSNVTNGTSTNETNGTSNNTNGTSTNGSNCTSTNGSNCTSTNDTNGTSTNGSNGTSTNGSNGTSTNGSNTTNGTTNGSTNGSSTNTSNATVSYTASINITSIGNPTTISLTCSNQSTSAYFAGWLGNNQKVYNTTDIVSHYNSGQWDSKFSYFWTWFNSTSTQYFFSIPTEHLRFAGENYTVLGLCVNSLGNTSTPVYGKWNQPTNGGKNYKIAVIYSYNSSTLDSSNITTLQTLQVKAIVNSNSNLTGRVVNSSSTSSGLRFVRMMENNGTNCTNGTNGTNCTNGTDNGTTNGTNGTTNGTNGTTNGTNGTTNVTGGNVTIVSYVLRVYNVLVDEVGYAATNDTAIQASLLATLNNSGLNVSVALVSTTAINYPVATISSPSQNTTNVNINVGSNVDGTYYLIGTADGNYNSTYLSSENVAGLSFDTGIKPMTSTGSIAAGVSQSVSFPLAAPGTRSTWFLVVQDNVPTSQSVSSIVSLTVSTSTNNSSFGGKILYGFALCLALFVTIIFN